MFSVRTDKIGCVRNDIRQGKSCRTLEFWVGVERVNGWFSTTLYATNYFNFLIDTWKNIYTHQQLLSIPWVYGVGLKLKKTIFQPSAAIIQQLLAPPRDKN